MKARGVDRAEPLPPPDPLPVEVADSHCHLDIDGGDRDGGEIDSGDLDGRDRDGGEIDSGDRDGRDVGGGVAAAVAAAQAVGVRRIVTIGVDVATSRWSADVAAAHPDVYAGVAIHPNDVTGAGPDDFAEIARLAALPQVRAVGETGLDYYRDWAPPQAQRDAFRRHIAIAQRTGKALVIHDREAHDDVLEILAAEGAPPRTVFHCFSGDAAMARVCAEAGYYMSFAGNVTFGNAQPLRDAAAVVPADLLLVETDAPYLTPVPYRGRPNASYLVPFTVRALAEARGESVEDCATAIAANTERVFGPWR